MTSSIIQFPIKHSNLSETVTAMADWFIKQDVPEPISNLFLNIPNDVLRNILPNNILDHISYGCKTSDENEFGEIFLQTNLRKNLVPEFGTQQHQKFLEIFWVKGNLHGTMNHFQENQRQHLFDYFNSYPEVDIANNVAMCYSILDAIVNDVRFCHANVEIDKDTDFVGKFTLTFTENKEEGEDSLLFILSINFLPILLDNNAMEFWDKKLKDK